MPTNYGILVETSSAETLSVYQKSMLGRTVSIINNHTNDIVLTITIQSFIFEHGFSSNERYFALTTDSNDLLILDAVLQRVVYQTTARDLGLTIQAMGAADTPDTFVKLEWLGDNCVLYMQRKWREKINPESDAVEDKFFYCIVILNPDLTPNSPIVTFTEGKTLNDNQYR